MNWFNDMELCVRANSVVEEINENEFDLFSVSLPLCLSLSESSPFSSAWSVDRIESTCMFQDEINLGNWMKLSRTIQFVFDQRGKSKWQRNERIESLRLNNEMMLRPLSICEV